MKNKIGLITFYKNNYGSILQCYATKKFLESNNYECEVLYQKEKNKKLKKILNYIKLILNSIKNPVILKDKIIMKKSMKKELSYLNSDTVEKMDKFVKNEIEPKGYYWSELRKKCNKQFKYFIVGSDQVWNASRKIPDIYMLKFAEKNKRIAFGISIGVEKIPEFNKDLKNGVKGFNEISVREESAISEISEIYKGKIERVGDPTTLYSKTEWKQFCKSVELIYENYILIHFLNEPNDLAIKCINEYINKKGKIALCLGYSYDKYSRLSNYKIINGDPREYVALILNADAIFTDSFHTTLFSINLQKQFYVFHRQYLHNYAQTSRISNLLKRYSIMYNFIEKFEEFDVNKITNDKDYLYNDRINTRKYLLSKLK